MNAKNGVHFFILNILLKTLDPVTLEFRDHRP